MLVSLEEAVQLLQKGSLVAVPTETVYGLAARFDDEKAIEQIFTLKGRPRNNPLIIHIAKASDALPFITTSPPGFEQLAAAFWPGPLTCVLPATEKISSVVRANLSTAAFRVPSLGVTQKLIEMTGPLVMPSANISGTPSATSYKHIEADFGKDFPVLKGEGCLRGVESTIIIFQNSSWVVGRLGAIPLEEIAAVLGVMPIVLKKTSDTAPLCPGLLHKHYAPKAHLVFGEENQSKATHILGFFERSYPSDKTVFYLGSLNKPEEVARNLYTLLRKLDECRVDCAWIDMDFPKQGLWKTISERVFRAANA